MGLITFIWGLNMLLSQEDTVGRECRGRREVKEIERSYSKQAKAKEMSGNG